MSEMQTIYFEDLPRRHAQETTRNVVLKEKVAAFAEISGDHNPIHLDEAYAATTPFGGCIAHGVCTRELRLRRHRHPPPGPGSIYISQSLSFRAPVMIGATVENHGRVIELIERGRRVKLKCECRVGDQGRADRRSGK